MSERANDESPRRVLMVIHVVAIGGMETFSIDLAGEYVRRGISVQVVFPELEEFDSLEGRFTAGGATVIRHSTDHRTSRRQQLRALNELRRLIRSFRPDVVHMQTGGTAGGLAVALTTRLSTRARLVLTEHSVPEGVAQRYHRVARQGLDRLLDTLVAVSRHNATIRRQRLGDHAPHFASILNGIPIVTTDPDQRAAARRQIRDRYGLEPDAFVIGSLVRLVDGKGIEDLIGALALLAGTDAHLLLVGDGPLRQDLEDLARGLGVHDRVIFAGFQRNTRDHLSAFDLFALAVPAGSMSIALLEAMSHRVPSMITFCGPEEAVIPDRSGFCAPPSDPPGLAAQIQRVADDRQLLALVGDQGARHIERHFSIRRVADDYLEVYRTARKDPLPQRLRADGPPSRYPGGDDSD